MKMSTGFAPTLMASNVYSTTLMVLDVSTTALMVVNVMVKNVYTMAVPPLFNGSNTDARGLSMSTTTTTIKRIQREGRRTKEMKKGSVMSKPCLSQRCSSTHGLAITSSVVR